MAGCVLLGSACSWWAYSGLKNGRLRSRYGVEMTAAERPYPYYITIAVYSLVACFCIYQAIRLALKLGWA